MARIEFKDEKLIVTFADSVDHLSFRCRKAHRVEIFLPAQAKGRTLRFSARGRTILFLAIF